MNVRLLAASGAVFALVNLGCGGPPDGFTDTEWETVQGMSPLPPLPADPTNKYADNEAAARLGQKLFFDTRYSGPLAVADDGTNGGLGELGETGKVSCGSCHFPEDQFADSRSKPGNVSVGANLSKRNSPALVNVAYYEWFTWAGRLDSLWTQGTMSPESPDLVGDRCRVAHLLWDHYRDEYDALFDDKLPTALASDAPDAARFPAACKPKAAGAADGPWEAMEEADRKVIMRIMSNVGKSFAAYERKLTSGDAPFDRYVAGEKDALNDSAKRGLKLFVGKGFCVQCHAGPIFTDQQFHNLGVPQLGPNVPEKDEGRIVDLPLALANPFSSAGEFSDDPAAGKARLEGLSATEADRGAFRTKNLRGVAGTAPYYHNGALGTLREVVDFYDRGGGDTGFSGTKSSRLKPLNLTDGEKDDLVAFLESLTGAPVPAEWGYPQ